MAMTSTSTSTRPDLNTGPRLCAACGSDISHRRYNARICEACFHWQRTVGRRNEAYRQRANECNRLKKQKAIAARLLQPSPRAVSQARPHTCRRCMATSEDNPKLQWIDYWQGGKVVWNCWACYIEACKEVAS